MFSSPSFSKLAQHQAWIGWTLRVWYEIDSRLLLAVQRNKQGREQVGGIRSMEDRLAPNNPHGWQTWPADASVPHRRLLLQGQPHPTNSLAPVSSPWQHRQHGRMRCSCISHIHCDLSFASGLVIHRGLVAFRDLGSSRTGSPTRTTTQKQLIGRPTSGHSMLTDL